MANPPTTFEIAEFTVGGNLGEIFTWVAAPTSSEPDGGARAIPHTAVEIGLEHKGVRVDYPMAKEPTKHKFGPRMQPQTFKGEFDDKYNFPGFAEQTMRRLEDLVARGNLVRVTFDAQDFYGDFDSVKFEYKRASLIGYTLVLDVHGRRDRKKALVQNTLPTANQAISDAQIIAQAVDAAHAKRPSGVLGAVNNSVSAVGVRVQNLSNSLDVQSGVFKPLNDLRAVATSFRQLQGDCSSVLEQLLTAKSTLNVAGSSAATVLDFDGWLRSTCVNLRLLRGHARKSSSDLQKRENGPVKRMYQPRKGQSLYDVSQAVYGDPFKWRAIANANDLGTFNLTGTEMLVIPEIPK